MKASIVNMKIELEVLSQDSIPGLLQYLIDRLSEEVETGDIRMSDGDQIKWDITSHPVEF